MSCPKLQLTPEPLTRGLPPQDPRSVCPLSSTEFVEPPLPEQNSSVRHCLQVVLMLSGKILFIFLLILRNR